MAENKQAEILAEKGRKNLIIQHSATVQSHVSHMTILDLIIYSTSCYDDPLPIQLSFLNMETLYSINFS